MKALEWLVGVAAVSLVGWVVYEHSKTPPLPPTNPQNPPSGPPPTPAPPDAAPPPSSGLVGTQVYSYRMLLEWNGNSWVSSSQNFYVCPWDTNTYYYLGVLKGSANLEIASGCPAKPGPFLYEVVWHWQNGHWVLAYQGANWLYGAH
jgi:hypothetical protein